MKITTVCSHCRHHDNEPNIEINFREGVVYYICPECGKESKIGLKAENKPYPKGRRIK